MTVLGIMVRSPVLWEPSSEAAGPTLGWKHVPPASLCQFHLSFSTYARMLEREK